MPRRSVLFSPGDRPDMMRKAPGTGADVVVFDLEDAVAPARKPEAREAINGVLTDPAFDPACEVSVRVNPTGVAADDDLDVVLQGSPRLDSVVLPKASAGDDVDTLERLLDEHAVSVPVIALIESAAGVLNAFDVANAAATSALAFGAEDLAADIGAERTPDGTEVLYAREHTVLAARAAGVDAIDTLYTAYDDVEGLRSDVAFSRQLGFDGKLAIHPAQVEPINEGFTPADADVEWARRVMAAKADADDEERGVFSVDGEMIDAPLVKRAERILHRADDA